MISRTQLHTGTISRRGKGDRLRIARHCGQLVVVVALCIYAGAQCAIAAVSGNTSTVGFLTSTTTTIRDVIVAPDDSHLYVATPRFSAVLTHPGAVFQLDLTTPGAAFTQVSSVGLPDNFWRMSMDNTGLHPLAVESFTTGSIIGDTIRFNGTSWDRSPHSETWGGGGPSYQVAAPNGDIWVCGGSHPYKSTNDGVSYPTAINDVHNWAVVPGPAATSPALAPSQPNYQTNAPGAVSYGWNYGLNRAPWSEWFMGGESQGFMHSTDDGATWSCVDPLFTQCQRYSSNYYPAYPNPAFVAGMEAGNHIGIGFTRQGEVLLTRVHNSRPETIYKLRGTGEQDLAMTGLPVTSPGSPSKMVQPDCGDTFASISYTSGAATKTNLFSYDGSDWKPQTTFTLLTSGAVAASGPTVFFGFGDGLFRWDPVGGTPSRPAISLGPAQTITLPSFASVTAAISPSGPWTYEWSARGPGHATFTDPLSSSTSIAFSNPGDFVINVQITSGTLTGGDSVIVHALPEPGGVAPTISGPPPNLGHPANQILTPGSPAIFTVSASGTNLQYQWKKDGSDLAGETSSALTIANPQASDSGSTYYCEVFNTRGHVVSNSGVLGNPPVITVPPASQTVSAGQPVSFTVAASGTTPVTWQWYRNGVAIATNDDLNIYTLNPAQATDDGAQFTVTVSNIFGSATSSAATLTIGSGATYQVNAAFPSYAPGVGYYRPGTVVGLAAAWRQHGYGAGIFQNWTTTAGTLTNPSQAAASVTTPIGGLNITATPVYKTPPANRITLVNGRGGGVFFAGNLTPITAEPPPPGMTFDKWIGPGVTSPTAPTTTATTPAAAFTRIFATYKPTLTPVTFSILQAE